MNYDEVVNNVCSKHSIHESIVMSKTKVRWVCVIRHEIMYKLKEAGYTLSEIGSILNMDHSSIMYGIKKHLSLTKDVKSMPPVSETQKKFTHLRYKLRKTGMGSGSMKEMMQEHLSDEVLERSLSKALSGRYSSLSEYFADIITEAYFLEKENEQG
tara:strand:+ start:842 stop:1309 length:468 start_codon:yes stop_codon:yes gene_type:complete